MLPGVVMGVYRRRHPIHQFARFCSLAVLQLTGE
jgi:hypothetical protein